MKARYAVLIMAVAVVLCHSTRLQGSVATRRDFETVAAQLDPGGEMFMVLQSGRWIDRLLKTLASSESTIPVDRADEKAVLESLERMRRYFNRMGISAWRGMGISSVSRRGDDHAVKCFILRDAVDSNLPFWRGFYGWQPRRLLSLDFIPAGFASVRAGTFDPEALWQMFKDGASAIGGLEHQVRFDQARAALTTTYGIDPEDIIVSLRDEYMVALRFKGDETFSVPVSSDQVTLPVPEVLVAIATGEDVLRGVIEATLAKHRISLTEMEVAGVVMRAADRTLEGGAFPIQPAIASVAGYLLISSSPAVMEEALLAYRHRNGLISRPSFQAAFKQLPMVNNGIFYIDENAARVIKHLYDSRAAVRHSTAGGSADATVRFVSALSLLGQGLPECALIWRNWKHGVMINGTSGIGGEALLRVSTLAMREFLGVLSHWTHTFTTER